MVSLFPTPDSHEHPALVQAQTQLARVGAAKRIAAAFEKGAGDVTRSLHQIVRGEVSAYSASGNPAALPDVERHSAEQVEEIRRLSLGGAIGDFPFVRTYGRHCAAQRFPLEAVLHAYRCFHKVLSQWMRDAAVAPAASDVERTLPAIAAAIADFTIEYTNTISTILAAEYVEAARVLAEAEGDRRTELLNLLLTGYDESDGRVGRLLKRAGYFEQRQSFCVVVAQSTDPLEMENPRPRATNRRCGRKRDCRAARS